MKKYILIVAMLVGAVSMAQEVKPTFEKQGDVVLATYYHDNGQVAQSGLLKENKPHGEWIAYNEDGIKTAQATYNVGEKVGLWSVWSNDELIQIEYSNNEIVAVTNWQNPNPVVSNKP